MFGYVGELTMRLLAVKLLISVAFAQHWENSLEGYLNLERFLLDAKNMIISSRKWDLKIMILSQNFQMKTVTQELTVDPTLLTIQIYNSTRFNFLSSIAFIFITTLCAVHPLIFRARGRNPSESWFLSLLCLMLTRKWKGKLLWNFLWLLR